MRAILMFQATLLFGAVSEFHVKAAVAALAVAHVDPSTPFLVDALVHGQVQALDERQQTAVAVW